VLRVLWWGSVAVGRVVRNFSLWVARGRKGRHVSSALRYRGTRRYKVAGTVTDSERMAARPGIVEIDITSCNDRSPAGTRLHLVSREKDRLRRPAACTPTAWSCVDTSEPGTFAESASNCAGLRVRQKTGERCKEVHNDTLTSHLYLASASRALRTTAPA